MLKAPFFSLALALALFASPMVSVAQEVDEPAPRTAVTETEGGLEVRTGKLVFTIEDPAPGSEQRALFEALSDQDKAQFLQKRKAGVLLVARILNALKYGFGVGAIVKDRLSFKKSDREDDKLLESVRHDPAMRAEIGAIVERERVARFEQQNQILKLTMRERAEVMIASIVRNFDKSIWMQAPVYSHSNEHAFYGGLGLGGIGKASKGRKIGGLFELGFTIGYNIEQKAVVIQLIRDVESFRESMMPMMVFGGVYFKAGYYFANQTVKGHLRHHGQSFYPPVLPGFTTTTADVVIVGMNAGLPFMTFPPAPFDNGLTYLNGAHPDAVLRITLSPKTLGFVRIQTVPLKVIVEPVTNAVIGIKRMIFGRGGACKTLFVPAGA